MKRVLIVAYAFPPVATAGVMRPLRFVKYLPRYGWESIVLTIRRRPDLAQDPALLSEIPAGTHVCRTFTCDPWVWTRSLRRRLSETATAEKDLHKAASPSSGADVLRPGFVERIRRLCRDVVSTPDHQISWLPFAVAGGLRLFRRFRYDAILTTSPPASSHLIGLVLSRLIRRPWLADFRDPWMNHPLFDEWGRSKPRIFIEKRLERAVIKGADAVVCNTPANRERLMEAYPELPQEKFKVIPNGYDKEYIDSIAPRSFQKLTIAHTGIFYPHLEPYFFFEALSHWIGRNDNERALDGRFQVLLVGSREKSLESLVERLKLNKYVQFVERVSHDEALAIAKGADALLVSLGFDRRSLGWVPLKLYDYLGCRKPILAFLPEGGQAAEIIADGNAGQVISTPSYERVYEFLDHLRDAKDAGRSSTLYQPHNGALGEYEQACLTERLSEILDRETVKG